MQTIAKKKKLSKVLMICSVSCMALAVLALAFSIPFGFAGANVAHAAMVEGNLMSDVLVLDGIKIEGDFAEDDTVLYHYMGSLDYALNLSVGTEYKIYMGNGKVLVGECIDDDTTNHHPDGSVTIGKESGTVFFDKTFRQFLTQEDFNDDAMNSTFGFIRVVDKAVYSDFVDSSDYEMTYAEDKAFIEVYFMYKAEADVVESISITGMSEADVTLTELVAGSTFEGADVNVSSGGIIDSVVGGFTTFLTGTGEGIASFFENVFVKEGGGISVMAIVFLSLMGLGLAIGMVRILLNRIP